MQVSPARRAAFEILRRVEEENAYSSVLLAAADPDLNSKDRALCHELVLGVLRQRLWLDGCIEHFAARRVEKIDLPVTLALRLGVYQLRFLSRIPASAAVNESVNLVHVSRLKSATSFANAILRRATREPDYDPAAAIDDSIERLAVATSHPRWLIERWVRQLGFDDAAALARANNSASALAFRFTAKAVAEGQTDFAINELRAAGAELRSSLIARDGWRVIRGDGGSESDLEDDESRAGLALNPAVLLRKLSEDGLIYFQDEGSQMVAQLVGVENNNWLLDVCAAPGSKSTLMASLAPEAAIVTGDLYEHRARTIKQFANQQEAKNIRPVVFDATHELPFTASLFDRVLVDAPCSGTGTLRNNPEIRWRLKLSDIAELAAKQKCILSNASAMVRPGGSLIYSTCSIETDENEVVISDFRLKHPDFEPSTFNLPANLSTNDDAVRTWPHTTDVDGFFVAAFRRKS